MAYVTLPRQMSEATLEDLLNAYNKLIKEITFILNNIDSKNITVGGITADSIRAGAIVADKIDAGAVTADKINVDQLSAISADMGKITAGEMYGAYIATSEEAYPRIEFSSVGELLQALKDPGNYISISPELVSGNPAIRFEDGSVSGSIGASIIGLLINTIAGNIQLSSGGDLQLYANGLARFQSWSKVYSDSNGQTLQQALNSIQNQLNNLNARVTALENSPP